MAEFIIENRFIGDNHPPVVIAEIGINHEGSLEAAIKIADAAINSGAEIIKHQTHIIEDEMSDEAKLVIPSHTKDSIYDIMKRCALSEDDEKKLMDHIKKRGAIFLSTPFSRAAIDRSGECNNYPLIKYLAKFKKPVILSTGMNSIETIKPSVEILQNANIPFALLHCTNVYPTPPELVRLGAIKALKDAFPDAVIGLSDHTTSNYTCLGAVALGASILERHFTDSMDRPGPDIACSMDPNALTDLINGSKVLFSARGGEKIPVKAEDPTIAFAFASVVAIKNINKGETLTEDNIWLKRPGGGDFTAKDYDYLIGKKVLKDISNGFRIKKENIA